MAIPFVAVPKTNPRDKSAPPTYYATAKSSGTVDLRKIAADIKDMSTASMADVMLVLQAIEEVVDRHLANGKIVDLGFVKLSPAVYSDGHETSEEVTPRAIRKIGVVAKVGKRLAGRLRTADLIRKR